MLSVKWKALLSNQNTNSGVYLILKNNVFSLGKAWNYWNKNERVYITIFYKILLSKILCGAFCIV